MEASKVLKPNEQKSTIKDAILEGQLNEVAKKQDRKKKRVKKKEKKGLVYETDKYVYNFQQFETIG